MFDLSKEILDLTPREVTVFPTDLFAGISSTDLDKRWRHLKTGEEHQTVLNVALAMWGDRGYNTLLDKHKFWEGGSEKFTGHCHQCTPVLGVVLRALGFQDVSYLECFRIREHFPQTGKIEKVPPSEETDERNKKEFERIGRIPYCCLEVVIHNQPFYITGKHIRPEADSSPRALLTPVCYRENIGVFTHQDDKRKSGIYLTPVIPARYPVGIDFTRRIVWQKQTFDNAAQGYIPELFATYLRMKIA